MPFFFHEVPKRAKSSQLEFLSGVKGEDETTQDRK